MQSLSFRGRKSFSREREYHEIYREIYGGPIYDVYEDDEIYKGDPIYDVYEENGFDNLVRAKIGRNLVYAEDFKHNQARAIFVQKRFYEEFGSCKICADSTCEDFAQHPTWKNRLKIRGRIFLGRRDLMQQDIWKLSKYLYYSLVYIDNYFLLYFLYFSSFPILIKIKVFIDLRICYK